MAKKRRSKRPAPPSLGRNPAVRPGAGPHTLDAEKREADRLRREIEEQRENLDAAEQEPTERDGEVRDA